jgi:hypothetical protein
VSGPRSSLFEQRSDLALPTGYRAAALNAVMRLMAGAISLQGCARPPPPPRRRPAAASPPPCRPALLLPLAFVGLRGRLRARASTRAQRRGLLTRCSFLPSSPRRSLEAAKPPGLPADTQWAPSQLPPKLGELQRLGRKGLALVKRLPAADDVAVLQQLAADLAVWGLDIDIFFAPLSAAVAAALAAAPRAEAGAALAEEAALKEEAGAAQADEVGTAPGDEAGSALAVEAGTALAEKAGSALAVEAGAGQCEEAGSSDEGAASSDAAADSNDKWEASSDEAADSGDEWAGSAWSPSGDDDDEEGPSQAPEPTFEESDYEGAADEPSPEGSPGHWVPIWEYDGL